MKTVLSSASPHLHPGLSVPDCVYNVIIAASQSRPSLALSSSALLGSHCGHTHSTCVLEHGTKSGQVLNACAPFLVPDTQLPYEHPLVPSLVVGRCSPFSGRCCVSFSFTIVTGVQFQIWRMFISLDSDVFQLSPPSPAGHAGSCWLSVGLGTS